MKFYEVQFLQLNQELQFPIYIKKPVKNSMKRFRKVVNISFRWLVME